MTSTSHQPKSELRVSFLNLILIQNGKQDLPNETGWKCAETDSHNF